MTARVVLITGMSGTGKSAVLAELADRGHRVIDTDDEGWSDQVPAPDGGIEQLWREDRIQGLLDGHREGTLFLSGCVRNQGRFRDRFDAVVLLSLPEDVLLDRIAARETNDFGKSDPERARIVADLHAVEPLLRRSADAEIDTRRPVDEVADMIEARAQAAP
jgi:dephospho-CoA kinase